MPKIEKSKSLIIVYTYMHKARPTKSHSGIFWPDKNAFGPDFPFPPSARGRNDNLTGLVQAYLSNQFSTKERGRKEQPDNLPSNLPESVQSLN